MFGREPVGRMFEAPSESSLGDLSESDEDSPLTRLRAARVWAWSLIAKCQQQNKQYYDRKARPYNCNVGDHIFIRVQKPVGLVRKLVPKYVGPYEVKNIKGAVLYVVPVAFPDEPPRAIHQDHTRPGFEIQDMQLGLEELQLPWTDPAHRDPHLEFERDESEELSASL
jgi:hypothetical protein